MYYCRLRLPFCLCSFGCPLVSEDSPSRLQILDDQVRRSIGMPVATDVNCSLKLLSDLFKLMLVCNPCNVCEDREELERPRVGAMLALRMKVRWEGVSHITDAPGHADISHRLRSCAGQCEAGGSE